MRAIARDVRSLGGIAATHELLARGHSPSGIFSAVRTGDVLRIRKGWYGNRDLDEGILRAWRVGGQLGCVSAAAFHGLWVPELPDLLHVSVPPLAAQLRRSTNHRQRLADAPDEKIRVHWSGTRSGDRTAVSVASALQQIFKCQPMEVGFVVFESALNLGRLDVIEYHEVMDSVPGRARRLALLADASSESGTESLLKIMLTRLAIPFRQQVEIEKVGRVDFVIGDRLVVEVDSKKHHADPYRDRHRDAQLSIAGYRSLRFMYSQVVYELPQVQAVILSALARSDHNRA